MPVSTNGMCDPVNDEAIRCYFFKFLINRLGVTMCSNKILFRLITLFVLIVLFQYSCSTEKSSEKTVSQSGINGVFLLDSASYKKKLNENVKFFKGGGSVYTQHYNSDGYEMLTIISQPQEKHLPIQFKVARLNKKFMMNRNVMDDIPHFTSSMGIKLGATALDVKAILGLPSKKIENEDITIYYFENKHDSTTQTNLNHEYSEYRFYNNKLVDFTISTQKNFMEK